MYDGSSLLLETPYRDRTIRAPIRHTIDVLILILYGFGKTNINISRLIIVVIINIIHCRRRRVYRWKEANGVKESSSWTKKVVYTMGVGSYCLNHKISLLFDDRSDSLFSKVERRYYWRNRWKYISKCKWLYK